MTQNYRLRFAIFFIMGTGVWCPLKVQAQDPTLEEMVSRQTEMENELRELRGRIEMLEHQSHQQVRASNETRGDSPSVQQSELSSQNDQGGADPSTDTMPQDDVQADGTHFLKPHYKKNASKPLSAEERKALSSSESKEDSQALSEEKDPLKRARDLITEGHYDQAKNILKAFIKKYPQDTRSIDAFYWLGEMKFLNGDYEPAAVYFGDSCGIYEKLKKTHKQLKETSRAANSLIQLARCLKQLGKNQEAKTTLEHARQEFKEHPKKMVSVMMARAQKEIQGPAEHP